MDAQQRQSAEAARKRWEFQARVKEASENRPTKQAAQLRALNQRAASLIKDGKSFQDPEVKRLTTLLQRAKHSALPSSTVREALYG